LRRSSIEDRGHDREDTRGAFPGGNEAFLERLFAADGRLKQPDGGKHGKYHAQPERKEPGPRAQTREALHLARLQDEEDAESQKSETA
jgi:hypothetical protein